MASFDNYTNTEKFTLSFYDSLDVNCSNIDSDSSNISKSHEWFYIFILFNDSTYTIKYY